RVGPDDRSWLLIKEHDEHARSEADLNVTEARPESVASGRDMPAIAAASDRVWHSNRDRPDPAAITGARRRAMPRTLPPMRAARARAVPKGDAWLHEIEVAGERVMCRIEEGRARLIGAAGSDRTEVLGALARAARALPVHDAILDGIATALGADGATHGDRPADTLYLVDIPYLDGHDLTRVPLVKRKALLETLVKATAGARGLRFTDHVEGQGDKTFQAATRLGAPGLVSKRAACAYRSGGAAPSDDWRVVRCPRPSGERAAVTPARAARGGASGGGAGVDVRVGARESGGAGRDVRIAGVRLTHPDRLLYPAVGVTKRELATFYETVAPIMLPHVIDRPLTLVRAPDGMKGASFYVRRPGLSVPPELRRAEIPEGTGSGPTMLVDDVAGLVALAQMNVLEIHTWNARVADIERPDRLVFDLDPGPRVTWNTVVEGAVHVRAALALLDLESFVKTTGSKGLHVVVPLVPAAGWSESLDFTRTVAQAISRAEPGRYTATLPKAGRENKILIDYLRNRRGATSVSVFSARARPLASVSVPVAWEDLGPRSQSDAFQVREVLNWLPGVRSDPWSGYGRVRQKLTAARMKKAEALAGRL
ncbi:MAG: non-homologous end-joining DNA ligase, partial [Pseudomonadota bacterium]